MNPAGRDRLDLRVLLRLLRADGGSVAVEYAVLIAMIAVIVVGVAALGVAIATGLFDPLAGYFS